MGSNFSALLKCNPPASSIDQRIAQLEDGKHSLPLSFPYPWIVETKRKPLAVELPNWFMAKDYSGNGGIRIWHAYRWPRFINDPDVQNGFISATKQLAELFSSEEAIITRDGSPILHAFEQGATYEEALIASEETEVAKIDDLYEIVDGTGTWVSYGYWRLI